MYHERKANISAFRGCGWNCTYCAFQNTLRFQSCVQCKKFEPHAHLEVLDRKPPTTKAGQFITMSLNGDVAFASDEELRKMLEYCNEWSDRTFMMQSKDPSTFLKFNGLISDNMIIGSTIESDINYKISSAPKTVQRNASMKLLDCRKMVTIEPILTFNLHKMYEWMFLIDPEVIYIGYDSKNNNLPEPTLNETTALIDMLRDSGFTVKEKLIRKAWYE